MKAKNRLILFALIVLMVLSFADSSVWAASRTSTQSGDFNDPATWGGVAPVAGDQVTITAGHTVTLNTSISLEDITINGTFEPDLGTRTLTITDDITIGSAGDVNYTANGGFINWVITQATDGTSEIINNGTVAGQFAVNNLTIGGAPGTTTLTNTAAIDDIYVHGTMTVTGSGDFTGASTSNVVFSNSAVKTLSFTGPAVFDDLNVAASSAITTSSDFTVNDDLTIGSSGALTVTGTGTMTTVATTITNGGTFSMASGTVWNMNGATTLGSDLSGIDSDVTLGAYALTLGGYSISGTGTFATSSGSSMSLNNADGVEGALDLSGGLTLNADTDYTFTGGATGFPASTTLSDIIIDGDVTSDDSFTVSGNFTVQGAGDSFTASAGTVTFSGTPTITNTGGAAADLTFYGLATTGTSITVASAGNVGFNVAESMNVAAALTSYTTTSDPINFTGTGSLTFGTATDAATAIFVVNTTGTVTLGSDLDITSGTFTVTTGTLDMASYTLQGSATPTVTIATGTTLKISHASGLAGSLPGGVAAEIDIADDVNYEFYGSAVTTGFTIPNAGTGNNTAADIADIGNLTISGAAQVVALGTTDATNRDISGNLTVTGTASLVLPYSTTDDLIVMSGTGSIVESSTDSPALQFNYLTVTGTVTTTADYAIVGILTGGGTFTNSSNTVTYTPGASMDSPVSTGITFNNLNLTGTAGNDLAPTTGTTITIAGDLVLDNGANFDFDGGANLVTFSGTNKGLYISNDGGLITFNDLTVSGSLTASTSGLTSTVNGIALNTSDRADFTIDGNANAAVMTVSGTFTAGTDQIVTFDGTTNGASLAGAGTKTFYDLVNLAGATTSSVNFTIANDFTVTAGTWTQGAGGTITMSGTAATLTTSAAVTGLTLNTGTLLIPSSAVVTIAGNGITATGAGLVSIASGGTIDLSTIAPAIDGTGVFTAASGSTVKFNAPLNTSIDVATITETATGANYVIGAAVTDAGLTTAGLNAPGDITINATGLTTLGGDVTMSGNLLLSSAASYINAATTSELTMSGTGKTITLATTPTPAVLSLDELIVTGTVSSASDFAINNVVDGNADILTVSGASASFTHTGTLTLSGPGDIETSGTLVLNNLTLSAATSDITTEDSFTLNGNLTIGNATASFDASAGTITLAGSGKTITLLADNAPQTSGVSTAGVEFFNLSVSGTYTQVGDFIIDLAGSTSALNVSGSFDANQLGAINLVSDNATITNTGTLILNDLFIDAVSAGSINAFTSSDFTIEGDLDVDAATSSFEATAGTITFAGTTAISGGATYATTPVGLKLWNVNVSGTVTEGDANGPTIFGDLTVTGSVNFTNGAHVTTFDGGTTKTITNTGTLIFDDLTIASTASNVLSTASDFSVNNVFIIGANGKLSATGGTITIDANNDNATLTIDPTSAASVQFAGLTIGDGTLTHNGAGNDDFNISGDLTFTATTVYTQSTTSKITFNGTDEQLIVGADAMNIDFDDVTVNNAAGIKLSHLTDNIAVDEMNFEGTLRLTSGDIDLNGENIITLNESLANSAKLVETEGNTVKNTGSSTSLGHIFWDENFGAALTNNIMGGLGAVMTTSVSPGTVTVKRYHTQLEPGGSVGASRWYSITSATTTGLNATLKLKYDGTELGAITSTTADMLYSDNGVTAGPWFVETSSASTEGTMMTLTSTGIDGFTGGTEFWTTADVNALSITMVPAGTKGLKSSPLTSGTADNAIMGYTLSSSSGTVDLSSLRFSLSRVLAATPEFSQLKLVVSDDNDYSTTDDNTELIDGDEGSPATISGGGAGDQTITFDVSALSQSIVNGTPKTYFLVVDVLSGLTTATTAIQPSVSQADVTPISTSGVVSTYDEDGTSFTFQPGMLVAKNFNGVTAGPLAAGQTSVAVFGFSIESSSNANFGGFSLSTDQDASEYFNTSTAKVYVSTDNSFATTADNTLLGQTATFAADSVRFVFNANQSLSTAAKYFFVVMDAKATVGENSAPITFSMKHENLTSTTAAPQFIDAENGNAATQIVGFAYSFLNSTATLSTSNMTAAGNISKGVNNQPLYAFTISSDNGNAVVFDDLTATVSFSNGGAATDLANYRLWYDANGNGYPDTGEQIATGTYNANATTGNLDFGTFSSTQSITSSRKYLITANVASGATAGAKATLSIENEDYVSLTSPATLNTKGSSSWSGNVQTIVTPGVATKVAIVGTYTTSITTGSTVGFAVQAQDASGYPANAASTQTITIVANNGTFTVGGTATGSLVAGTSLITVSPALTAAAGSTTASVYATATSLTQSSATSSPITIFPAEATTQASVLTVGTATATTIPVTGVTAGNGDGRIIVIRQGLPPVAPTDGVTYTSSTNVGEASGVGVGQTGAGSYVVSTSSSSFTVSGLLPNQIYYIQAFEYVGTGSLRNYNATASPNSNPLRVETANGTLGVNTDSTLAVNLITDVDFSSSITTANETEFFSFIVPSSKNNVLVKLSSLPANYNVQLFYAPGAVANMSLIRESRVTSTGNEYMILNNAQAGKYILKVFGADGDQYSSSNYTIRITTSANELMSQQE